MLKLTKTGIGLLTRQYRSVLHKCWLINVGLWQAMGDAVSKAVSVPARLIASLLSGGAMSGEAFNVLDEILLSRLFERKLASLTAIGLGIAAATMPTEAEAGLLCYASDGTVKYTVGTACPAGTTTRLISLNGIDSTAAIGENSTALGTGAQTTGNSSTALGTGAEATGNSSTALGRMTQATGGNSTALGDFAKAYGDYSMAQGHGAYTGYKTTPTTASSTPETSPTSALAIGQYAGALTNNSIAVGQNATAGSGTETTSNTDAIAIGQGATATKGYSMAVGAWAQATGNNAMALGGSATGDYSVALGRSATATKDYSTALGGSATGDYSVALGYRAQAKGERSIAIGYKSVADEAYTVSFGHWGADSATLAQMKADIDNGMLPPEFLSKYAQYNASSQASTLYMNYKMSKNWDGAVEASNIAGEYRRITNVADGVNAHDAVTLGQLQNNYYRNYGDSMTKSFTKSANNNNFTTLNCVKEA